MEPRPVVRTSLSADVKRYLLKYVREVYQEGGRKLPSENTLCRQLGVSRVTLRRALDELEKDGVLLRIQGKGTFINDVCADIRVNLMPGDEYAHLLRSLGYETRVEVASILFRPATEREKAVLGEQTDQVCRIEKVYEADGTAAIISIDILDAGLVGHQAEAGKLEEGSTFALVRQISGQVVERDKIALSTACRTSILTEADSLARMTCDSLLIIDGINYNQENLPILMDRCYFDTSYVRFELLRVKNVYV